MEKVVRKIYEDMPETLTLDIPLELQHCRAEVIILPLEQEVKTAEEKADGAHGQIADPDILKFFGSMPDLPERESQGEYETREDTV